MFVICWLLHPDPHWRMTLADLEENPWVMQEVDVSKYSMDEVLGMTILYYLHCMLEEGRELGIERYV